MVGPRMTGDAAPLQRENVRGRVGGIAAHVDGEDRISRQIAGLSMYPPFNAGISTSGQVCKAPRDVEIEQIRCREI